MMLDKIVKDGSAGVTKTVVPEAKEIVVREAVVGGGSESC